ncbi:hypothetical protein [Rahnella perminowiae]|uniref:hypothetical protein n=1 Tax=Rahnella perminowiae TaxID=2816244 RepID=UPI00215C796E|nr:hypothetical protein [Rahnella perminowiae]MCR8998764.1 hypothetical protein [Rahnella perminowiae]MCR9003081.1 hypothetical protein [Rahnella perminowiae]
MANVETEERQENLEEWFELFSGLPLRHSEREARLINFCEKNRVSIMSVMPWIASEFAEHGGFSGLFHFIHLHGGRKIYMPKEAEKFHQIYGINIPQNKYNRIYKKIDSSGYLDTPSNWGVFIAIRRAAMQVAMKEDIPAKLLTQNYKGNVYIDACESADNTEDLLSFAETFYLDFHADHQTSKVLGITGVSQGMIPLPDDSKWIEVDPELS